jgi:prepilin-type N-terminal cleavage/methylation domain-containing protein
MPASPAAKSRLRAFTLVELMVSISVLSILVLMFTTLFNSASHAWVMGSGNVERRRNVRALTDYIGTELKAAMLPIQTVNLATTGNLQLLVNPSNSQVPTAYQNSDSIFWQAPLATEATYGDIAEIGYFVKWQDNGNGQSLPVLCRFFVNPSITGTDGSVSSNPNFLVFDPDPNRWLSSGLVDVVAPATSSSGYRGLFCENVVGLWIRSYSVDGKELPRSFDSRQGYDCAMQKTVTNADGSNSVQTWTEKRYLPARITVSIAQVDSHYTAQLAAAGNSIRQLTGSTSIRDAEQFLETFRQQAIGSSPLKPLLPGLRIYTTQVLLTNAQ